MTNLKREREKEIEKVTERERDGTGGKNFKIKP